MKNIVAQLLTPRKQHAPPPSPSPVKKDDDDAAALSQEANNSDDGRVDFDLSWNSRPRRTPVAAKRITPRRQSLTRETPPRYVRKLGQPSPRIALSEIYQNYCENRDFVEAAKKGGLNADGATATTTTTTSTTATTTTEADMDIAGDRDEEDDNDDWASDTSGGQEYAFKRFLNHRWADNSIEIEVEWEGFGETTWEPEVILQQDAPDALFAYWRSQQGGRPTNPFNSDMFEIFAIRKHSRDRKRYLVEWVGYEPKEASWVTRKDLEETAGDVVTEYWDALDAAKK